MPMRKGFEPSLEVDGVTVTARDVEMLRAIDREGSMAGAAEALGRSYGHLQPRVVELEGAIGPLTARSKGGRGGGGTELTDRGRELLRQFERLRVELAGVATIGESVVRGTIISRRGEVARVRTPAGELQARAPEGEVGDEVELAIRSDAVVVMRPDPGDGEETGADTSLRNRLSGTVVGLDEAESIATVQVDVGGGVTVASVITDESVERLGLAEGVSVVAAFKTTATRATPVEV